MLLASASFKAGQMMSILTLSAQGNTPLVTIRYNSPNEGVQLDGYGTT